MKLVSILVSTLFASAAAAPAIVWSSASTESKHISDLVDAKDFLSNVASSESSAAVFFVGRDASGSEGLTGLTSSGSLPKVASKYSEASSVHHYVRGIESINSITQYAKDTSSNVIESNLSHFTTDLARENSDLVIVNVPASASAGEIDAAVTAAIENEKIGSVVLTAVRGLSEVKLERDANSKRSMYKLNRNMNRRRLEDGNNDDENSTDGIYFVNFTPNIFAGLLFFFFFTAVIYTGIGCLGMIAGQDVYVSKYPTIGREH